MAGAAEIERDRGRRRAQELAAAQAATRIAMLHGLVRYQGLVGNDTVPSSHGICTE